MRPAPHETHRFSRPVESVALRADLDAIRRAGYARSDGQRIEGAAAIGVPIRACVVIEDSLVGLEAAKAAGARCIAVTNTFPRKKLAAADRIVDSLTQVDLAMLLALVA